jgi:hypothetical protein
MPVVVVMARGVSEMSLDDVLIAMTLAGLLLSGAYIRACFRELRMERDNWLRRSISAQRSGVDRYHR